MGYFRYFVSQTGLLFRPVPYTFNLKNKIFFYKKSFKLLYIKDHKFHRESVKNESGRTKTLQEGRQTPTPACLRLKFKLLVENFV